MTSAASNILRCTTENNPPLSSQVHQTFAKALYQAMKQRQTLAPLISQPFGDQLTLDDAYQISLATLALKQDDGEQVVGKKIGVTSAAVQQMLNVHQPDFGFLTDTMQYPNQSCISLADANLIQPRAEGEIAFCLAEDLSGPGITAMDVLDATQWVAPCVEVVDSRIDDWQISIIDTVADNASCGVFVLGEQRVDPRSIDLAQVRMTMCQNDLPVAEGFGSAVQGHPAQAVAWLANTLGRYGIPFKKGEIILSGALAPLVDVHAGDRFSVEISGLGNCSLSFCP